jgi:hypothetical protein
MSDPNGIVRTEGRDNGLSRHDAIIKLPMKSLFEVEEFIHG